MSGERRSRRRAVRLTGEAHEALRRALVEKWEAGGQDAKFTRETRAELLGLCVKTADKIWAGDLADRGTFALAFRSLGLEWSESYCDCGFAKLPPTVSSPAEEAPPAPRSASRFAGPALVGGFALLLLAAALFRLPAHAQPMPPQTAKPAVLWTVGFYRILADGSARFHNGDYDNAKIKFDEAVEIARAHRSPGDLSCAVRMAGDLESERGDFLSAEKQYTEALDLRTAFKDDVCRPPILEALGDAQTQSGEYESARNSLNAALEGYRRFDDPVGVAMAARDLGSLSFHLGHLQAATWWFRVSLDAIKRTSKPDIVADVRGRSALVACALGRIGDARQQLRECLDYWTSRDHPRWIAVTQMQLGTVEEAGGNFAVASALLAKSKGQFESLGDKANCSEAMKHLQSVSAHLRRAQRLTP